MLSVNPDTSVYFEVSRIMQSWLRDKNLLAAKAVVFVFDPRHVSGGFYREECHEVYNNDIKVKYRITGRDNTAKKSVAAAKA